jgi:hypothetical protein
MILNIPIKNTPNQTLKVVLGGQYCRIDLTTLTTGLYMDLFVDDNPIIQGAICLFDTYIVRQAYLGFIGDLFFIDTQGNDNPEYSGLGTRFFLFYVSP